MTSAAKGELRPMPSNEERFKRLHDEHFESIRRYAWRREPALADDIVSETFLVAWRRLDDVPDDAGPWLFGVARNVRLNLQRSARRQQAVARRLTVAEPSSEPPEQAESAANVRRALAALPERDREVLLLHAWEGLDRRQIAVVLGCSLSNAGVRLHRARRRFAAALPADGPNLIHSSRRTLGGASDDR
jgi:RNA polymerase sigma-70 factor (ECF subfamily)